MTMILKGSEQSILFTVVYRLVGFSMVPVGMELTDLALRVWSACVPSTTVNQVYMSHQIGSVQVGPVAIDVGTMDVGALPLPHSTPISQLLTCQPPSSSLVFFSPIARSTTAGPAVRICAVAFDMTEKCEATSRAAGNPATAPIAAVATGTLAIACATDRNRGRS